MRTISNTPPDAAVAAMQAGVTRILREVVIYESNGVTVWTPQGEMDQVSRLVSGTVSLDYGRDERRVLDIELDNEDDELSIEDAEGFWYDKIIKVYRGVRYPVTPTAPLFDTYDEWLTQMGEFMIDKISEQSNSATIKISGRDQTKKCLTSKFERSMTFRSGTPLYDLIRNLASNCGIAKKKIPYTTEVLTSPLDVERGTERWKVMKDAANSFSYDLYFDNEGYLTMSKYADPSTNPSIAFFRPGAGGNLVSYDRSTDDSRLYNHIVVTGDRESVEGGEILLPYFGEAKNEDPTSPTRIEKIGDRPYFYASSFFTSDQQCKELAESWLKIYSLESYEIAWSAIQYPWLDVGKVIEIESPKTGEVTKFLLDTLSFPLTLEPMSGSGKRVLTVR